MKIFRLRSATRFLYAAIVASAGCSGWREAEVIDAGVEVPLVCETVPPPEVTWSYLYDAYFGPGTPGHCGNAGCHDAPLGHGGWICGTSADSCYHGMLARVVNNRPEPLLDLADPPASLLISPSESPLVWFNPKTGNMPRDAPWPNPCAVRDLPLWLHPDGGAQE